MYNENIKYDFTILINLGGNLYKLKEKKNEGKKRKKKEKLHVREASTV